MYNFLNVLHNKRFAQQTSVTTCDKQNNTNKVSREYYPDLKKFAITLYYYSPRAYNYVRKQFNLCLPHPKSISRWYASVNGEPGFISEVFTSITNRVKSTNYELVGILVFDEMSIRQYIEYDGTKYSGYVDFRNTIASDDSSVAKDALVFLFVCMNSA